MPKNTGITQVSKSLRKLESELLRLRNPKCKLCPLHKETTRVCVIGNPPLVIRSKRLALVGEAPGSQEEITGRLFSGPAGQYLEEALRKVGLKREWFFVTNVVKCRPQDNATPSPSNIKTCTANYLLQELEVVAPSYGLLFGNSAIRGVLGRSGITKYNGEAFERNGTTWVAAVHPAAVLRNPRYESDFMGALLAFARLVRGEEGEVVTQAILVNSKEVLRELADRLSLAHTAAIDIETASSHRGVGRFPGGGLAWWDFSYKLTSINFTFEPGVGFVLPLWHPESRWRDPQKVLNALKPYIEGVSLWIMHNGMFDQKGLEQFGIHIRQSFDTMGAQYALDENVRKDLGFMSQYYLGAPQYKRLLDKADTTRTPLGDLAEYGARDSDYTRRLYPIMRRRLRRDGLSERLFYKLLMPAANVLSEIELTGLPIHRGKFNARRMIAKDRMEAEQEKLFEVAGRVFNPRSPKQLAGILFDELDFPILKETKGGAPSTDEETLVRLGDLDDTGIVDAILEFRKWQGYLSRYFDSWAGLMDDSARLHGHFKPFHTVTGRLSCENPNLQQVPRDPFIRGIIGGRRGWRIVDADYSQIELRIVAHYSQDKSMLRAFNTNRDIHTETAMEVTGLSDGEITSEIRKKAKAVNFGFVYGMGWRKFIQYARTSYGVNVSDLEAQDVRRIFFTTYRSLEAWHERQRSAARRRKWVISAIGRKRRLWDIVSTNKLVREEAERQAINSPVQSLASDMMLMSMVKLHGQLDPRVARIISTVHDSILFEVREEALDDVVPRILEVMENLPLKDEWDTLLTVPIVTDSKVGRFWSEDAEAFVRR